MSEGDEMDLDYDFETETYIVTSLGSELGKINKNKSESLQDYESERKQFYVVILELDEEIDKIYCKTRIFKIYLLWNYW